VLSCGGNDKCIMQWRHVMADLSGSGGLGSSSSSAMLSTLSDIDG
jgi:hypothetical protein